MYDWVKEHIMEVSPSKHALHLAGPVRRRQNVLQDQRTVAVLSTKKQAASS
jgi:hypothetical protein